MADVPHFDLPFLLGKAGAVEVEQDSLDDVANCVVAVVSTYVGWRDEVPSFGIPDLPMRRMPIGSEDIATIVGNQEPRAILIVDEHPDLVQTLVDTINVGVSLYEKGGSAT